MTHTIRKFAAAFVLALLAPLAFAQGAVSPAMFTPFKKGGGLSSGATISGCTSSILYADAGSLLKCDPAAVVNGSVSTAGRSILTIQDTMVATSATSNFLNVSGTFPSGTFTSGQLIAPILFNVAGSGATAVSADTAAIRLKFDTGTPNINAGSYGNFGILADATLRGNSSYGSSAVYTSAAIAGRSTATTGTEIVAGLWGLAAGTGTTRNFGVLGEGVTGGALSVGVVGRAANATNNVGGYFTLGSAVPTGTTAALIIDNSSVAANIFEARDNGTAVFTIQDGGAITATGAINANGGGIYSYNSGGYGFANNGGSATTPLIRIETAITPDALTFDTDTTSNSVHISERSDIGFDFNNGRCGVSACTDPAVIIRSHNQATNEYVQLSHDGTLGHLDVQATTQGRGQIALGGVKDLTESSATVVVDIPVASGSYSGATIDWTVVAQDATDFQSRHGSTYLSAVNKAGTETCSVGDVGTTVAAVSVGTLTATTGSDTTGSNVCTFTINAVSSLTQTSLRVLYTVIMQGVGIPTAR